MNYASPEKLAQLADSHRRRQHLLLHKVKVLKAKLDNFMLVDADCNPIGEVRNLVLYKQRLHLVIVQPDVHQNWRFMLLQSQLVQRINTRDRVILTHVTHTDVNYLPEQRAIAAHTRSQLTNAHASIASPVRQLPASLPLEPTQCLEAVERIKLEPLAALEQDDFNVSPVWEYPAASKIFADIVEASVGQASNRSVEFSGAHRESYPTVISAKPVAVKVSERLP